MIDQPLYLQKRSRLVMSTNGRIMKENCCRCKVNTHSCVFICVIITAAGNFSLTYSCHFQDSFFLFMFPAANLSPLHMEDVQNISALGLCQKRPLISHASAGTVGQLLTALLFFSSYKRLSIMPFPRLLMIFVSRQLLMKTKIKVKTDGLRMAAISFPAASNQNRR